MHELAAGQDTQFSWPVGITGFGLGVTDQPPAEALTGTEAFAGIAATPARTTAARRTDTFAAFRLVLPSRERRRAGPGQTESPAPATPAGSAAGAAAPGRLVQNFMITPMLQRGSRGPRPYSAAGRWRTGRRPVLDGPAGAEPGQVHEPFAGDAEPVAGLNDGGPGRALEQAQHEVIGGEQQAAEVGDRAGAGGQAGGAGAV